MSRDDLVGRGLLLGKLGLVVVCVVMRVTKKPKTVGGVP